jgi:hypothetical protein
MSYNGEQNTYENKTLGYHHLAAWSYNFISTYPNNVILPKSFSEYGKFTQAPLIVGDIENNDYYVVGLIRNPKPTINSNGAVAIESVELFIYDPMVCYLIDSGVFTATNIVLGPEDEHIYINLTKNRFKYKIDEAIGIVGCQEWEVLSSSLDYIGDSDRYLSIHGINIYPQDEVVDRRKYSVEVSLVGKHPRYKITTECFGDDLSKVLTKTSSCISSYWNNDIPNIGDRNE